MASSGFTAVPIPGYPEAEAIITSDGRLVCDSHLIYGVAGFKRWTWLNHERRWLVADHYGVAPEPHVAATLMLLFPDIF